MVYTLEKLRQKHLAGKQYRYLFFWGHTPSADGSIGPCCLSQWWMQPFEMDGVVYRCAEQVMMAEKARLFADDDMLAQIMEAKSPKVMKALGRQVRNFDERTWNDNCRDIVYRANLAKFTQNPALCQFLLETRGRIIVEASPVDRVWGIGLGKDHPDAKNPIKWRGSNLLGFVLTQVRDEIIQQGLA